ncbi:MAG TPA: hypothetical protein VFG73_02360 [Rhodanobacteraceae bacterium]|nr:hypothetical protein [Rhodanobacteraceae bacterium]
MTEPLTRPERYTAMRNCHEVVDKVRAAGGCHYCQHRAAAFGGGRRAACGLDPPRAFPACVDQHFEFDDTVR